jgi:hypothetical protein
LSTLGKRYLYIHLSVTPKKCGGQKHSKQKKHKIQSLNIFSLTVRLWISTSAIGTKKSQPKLLDGLLVICTWGIFKTVFFPNLTFIFLAGAKSGQKIANTYYEAILSTSPPL